MNMDEVPSMAWFLPTLFTMDVSLNILKSSSPLDYLLEIYTNCYDIMTNFKSSLPFITMGILFQLFQSATLIFSILLCGITNDIRKIVYIKLMTILYAFAIFYINFYLLSLHMNPVSHTTIFLSGLIHFLLIRLIKKTYFCPTHFNVFNQYEYFYFLVCSLPLSILSLLPLNIQANYVDTFSSDYSGITAKLVIYTYFIFCFYTITKSMLVMYQLVKPNFTHYLDQAKQRISESGFGFYVESEWARLKLPQLLRIYWIVRTIFLLLSTFFLDWPLPFNYFENFSDNHTLLMVWILRSCLRHTLIFTCDNYVSLLGGAAILCHVIQSIENGVKIYAERLKIFLISKSDNAAEHLNNVPAASDHSNTQNSSRTASEDANSISRTASLVFIVSSAQSGLTSFQNPNFKLDKLGRNLVLSMLATVHFIHDLILVPRLALYSMSLGGGKDKFLRVTSNLSQQSGLHKPLVESNTFRAIYNDVKSRIITVYLCSMQNLPKFLPKFITLLCLLSFIIIPVYLITCVFWKHQTLTAQTPELCFRIQQEINTFRVNYSSSPRDLTLNETDVNFQTSGRHFRFAPIKWCRLKITHFICQYILDLNVNTNDAIYENQKSILTLDNNTNKSNDHYPDITNQSKVSVIGSWWFNFFGITPYPYTSTLINTWLISVTILCLEISLKCCFSLFKFFIQRLDSYRTCLVLLKESPVISQESKKVPSFNYKFPASKKDDIPYQWSLEHETLYVRQQCWRNANHKSTSLTTNINGSSPNNSSFLDLILRYVQTILAKFCAFHPNSLVCITGLLKALQYGVTSFTNYFVMYFKQLVIHIKNIIGWFHTKLQSYPDNEWESWVDHVIWAIKCSAGICEFTCGLALLLNAVWMLVFETSTFLTGGHYNNYTTYQGGEKQNFNHYSHIYYPGQSCNIISDFVVHIFYLTNSHFFLNASENSTVTVNNNNNSLQFYQDHRYESVYSSSSGGSLIRACMTLLHFYFNIWLKGRDGLRSMARRLSVNRILSKLNKFDLIVNDSKNTNKKKGKHPVNYPEEEQQEQDLMDDYQDAAHNTLMVNLMSESPQCSICRNDFLQVISTDMWKIRQSTDIGKAKLIQTPCNHIYHVYCLRRWLYKKDDCPMCRATLSLSLTS